MQTMAPIHNLEDSPGCCKVWSPYRCHRRGCPHTSAQYVAGCEASRPLHRFWSKPNSETSRPRCNPLGMALENQCQADPSGSKWNGQWQKTHFANLTCAGERLLIAILTLHDASITGLAAPLRSCNQWPACCPARKVLEIHPTNHRNRWNNRS